MRRVRFENTGHYHIYNRGVNKSPIFYNEDDYLRFLHGVYFFNDSNFTPEDFYHPQRYQGLALDAKQPRNEMVDILAWCLMPNHYHFILSQKTEKGISKFMHRLGTGYTMYLNRKYEGSGHVFQGTFRAKLIDNNEYFQHLTRYIHINPVSAHDKEWGKYGVRNLESSKQFLLKYKWSSLSDYLDLGNRFKITSATFKNFVFTNDPDEYSNFLWEWLKNGLPNNFPIQG
ncbi:MAG: transposase [Minisyncoccia bacterium]